MRDSGSPTLHRMVDPDHRDLAGIVVQLGPTWVVPNHQQDAGTGAPAHRNNSLHKAGVGPRTGCKCPARVHMPRECA